MRKYSVVLICLLVFVGGCSDDDEGSPAGTSGKIETTDDLLARTCELGGDCNDGSTAEEIGLCPGELLAELSVNDMAFLETVLELEADQQAAVLECFGQNVCSRFGGSVLSMSDSDLTETLAACLAR
jgi:hypothetical protein